MIDVTHIKILTTDIEILLVFYESQFEMCISWYDDDLLGTVKHYCELRFINRPWRNYVELKFDKC